MLDVGCEKNAMGEMKLLSEQGGKSVNQGQHINLQLYCVVKLTDIMCPKTELSLFLLSTEFSKGKTLFPTFTNYIESVINK